MKQTKLLDAVFCHGSAVAFAFVILLKQGLIQMNAGIMSNSGSRLILFGLFGLHACSMIYLFLRSLSLQGSLWLRILCASAALIIPFLFGPFLYWLVLQRTSEYSSR